LELEYAVMGQEPKELNRDALYAYKISRGWRCHRDGCACAARLAIHCLTI
jgi:hypothetical protein